MSRRFLFLIVILMLLGLGVGSASAQNSYSLWFGSFWNNTDMEGQPVYRASSGEINFDWGSGSPNPSVSKDGWSAQWSTIVPFSSGTYRFTVQNDDGAAIFLGDKHILNDWNTHPLVTQRVDVSLAGGEYPMAVSFFDKTGLAVLKLSWERIGPAKSGVADVTVVATPVPTTPAPSSPETMWLAKYWNNTEFIGSPVLSQYESEINHDWALGSPSPGIVNANNFSASWTRSVYFTSGTYRFTTQSDDGIRVYVGDRLIIDHFNAHALASDVVDISLVAGTYNVVVHYYEHGGQAVAKLWWEKIGGGDLTGVTATVAAYALNLREGPGTGFKRLTAIPGNTTVQVVGRNSSNTWLQVVYNGITGWSSASFLRVTGDLKSAPVTW